ncbi:MAG: Ada metal-binding domain-containing protein [Acidobacteriota bacterium]
MVGQITPQEFHAEGLLPPATEMATALEKRDPDYDGRFIFGVLSTGIYCRPSCPARRPLPKNVRFYLGPPEARAAGLRPCRRCLPDRSADADAQEIEALLARLDQDPAAYAGVEDLATDLGIGLSKLNAWLRRHVHETPGRRLLQARLESARQRLLRSDETVAAIAYDVGFESLSSFTERFRAAYHLSPSAFRGLRDAASFRLSLPQGYETQGARSYLGRDPAGTFASADGEHFAFGLRYRDSIYRDSVHRVRGRFVGQSVECEVEGASPLPEGVAAQAHRHLLRWIGLSRDPLPYRRFAERREPLQALVQDRPLLCLYGPGDPFLALLWTILGQQVTLGFASTLLARLGALAGAPVGGGLHAPPRPEDVAALDEDSLREIQLSRSKASYVRGVARAVAEGDLDLEGFRRSTATLTRQRLLAQRGLGPWSVNYLMLRAFGFGDALPVGDAGLARGLVSFLQLEQRPDAKEQARLMAPFAPYRGWTTLYLWHLAMEA